jgi:hypothetical protein
MMTGKKKGWWELIQNLTVDSETDEDKKKRDSAGYYFIHTCKGEVETFAVYHQGDAHLILKDLKEEFENKEKDDTVALYDNLDRWIKEGLDRQIPKLWFMEIKNKENEIVKAKGQKKQTEDLLILVHKVLEHHPVSKSVHTAWKLERSKTLDEYKEAMHVTWKDKVEDQEGKAKDDIACHVVDYKVKKSYGSKKPWKPIKGNCHGCGKQGHRKADCPAQRCRDVGQPIQCR